MIVWLTVHALLLLVLLEDDTDVPFLSPYDVAGLTQCLARNS